MTARGLMLLGLLLPALLVLGAESRAHPLAPALLEIDARAGDGGVAVTWRMPAVRVAGSDLRPLLPTSCPLMHVAAPLPVDDGAALETRYRLTCPRGIAGERVGVNGLEDAGTNALLLVRWPDGGVTQALLSAGQPTALLVRTPPLEVMGRYLALGVDHLLLGWDHLLLVLGLVLLVRGRRLIGAVTAFTLGHSVTLALAGLGVVDVGGPWVEVAIAASLVLLADEAMRRSAGLIAQRPWLVCTALGLLHGLGFAGALSDVGLPDHAIPPALFAFNLGIELAQLAVIALAVLLRRLARAYLPALARGARGALAFGIGAVGCYALLLRLFVS